MNLLSAISNNPSLSSSVVILAPRLRNMVGHEFEYTKAVVSGLEARGCVTKVIGALDAEEAVRSLPGFEGHFPLQPIKSDPVSILRQARVFSQHLKKIMPSLGIGPNNVVFIHTISHTELLGWHLAFSEIKPYCGKPVFLFRFSLALGHRWDAGFSRFFLRSLYQRFFRHHKNPVQVVVDSPELKNEYESLLSVPITVLPIPLNTAPFKDMAQHHFQHQRKDRIRLAYIGDARLGRGFDLLPEIVAGILAQKPNIEFVIHCGRVVDSHEAAPVQEAARYLSTLNSKNVHFTMGSLSYENYLSLLRDSDAVMIPSRREHYGSQTSNVLTETFACGLPAIVPDQTWMANRVRETNAGTIFESGNAANFIEKALTLIDNLESYTKSAQNNQPLWVNYHNANSLAAQLLALVES